MSDHFRFLTKRILVCPRLPRQLGGAGAALAILMPSLASAAEPILETFRRDVQPVLQTYCYDCHGDGNEKGGVRLDGFTKAAELRDHTLWLKALKNIRSGVMPPASEEHPLPPAEAEKISQWIKLQAFGLDPVKPDPGRVTVRRLNRVEYRNTIRELTGVDYDTGKEFPADDTGFGFDNIADVLTVSPLLIEKYIDAAQAVISKAVVTKPRLVAEKSVLGREFATIKVDTTLPEPPKPATPAEAPVAAAAPPPAAVPAPSPVDAAIVAIAVPGDAVPAPGAAVAGQLPAGVPGRGRGQAGRGAGRGFGQGRGRGAGPPPVTRPAPIVEGDAIVLSYYTPAVVAAKPRVEHAGKYQLVFDLLAQETYADNLFDLNKCQFILSLDGEKLLDQEFVREGYGKKFEFTYDRALTAGEHEITMEIKPLGPETPQYRKLRIKVNSVTVRGPLAPEFWVRTPGYEKYFPRDVPAAAKDRQLYARELLEKFATRAFRAPVNKVTLDQLVALAEKVSLQPTSTFEAGVAQAMVAVLASPTFIFREDRTEPLKRGQAHPFIDEYALASRLSYFFWSSMPDDELTRLATTGGLRANLPAQIARLMKDGRSKELVHNFAGQWLQARDIANVQITADDVYLRDHPNPELEEAREVFNRVSAIPQSDRSPEDAAAFGKARGIVQSFNFARQNRPDLTDKLRKAMQQETEMTFEFILREDRSLLELLESDYTFLNEELAKHYEIEGVSGPEMRKVTLAPDSPRGGVLTQGTVLAVTSNPTRTSPVKRGVFILDAILGMPAAPPPPNIPALEDAAPAAALRKMSLRDTMDLHRKNALCASCHARMDPIGLALENFNAMGMWRTTDANQPVQPAGKLVTGESFANIRELKHIFATTHRRDFYYCLSEKLLTYALGRGLEYYDTITVDQLVAKLEASGGRPSALLQAIVESAPFQQRRQAAPALADDTTNPGQSSARLAQTSSKP